MTAGTYRVSESSNGGATYTEVSLASMPPSASGNNTTSGTFTWGGTSNGSQNVYFLNVKTGSLTVKKFDDTSLNPLVATFKLYTDLACTTGATYYGSNTAVGDIITIAGTATVNNLAYGTYYLKETVKPSGYLIDTTVRTIVIPAAGGNSNVLVEVPNNRETGLLIINKFDSVNQSPLVATFKLYTDYGCTTEAKLWDKTTLVGDIVTTAGTATVNNLAYGIYYLKETVKPSGYLIDTTVRAVAIPDFDGRSTSVMVNLPNNKEGKITVIKRDITDDSLLAGAVFGLFTDEACKIGALDASGNPVANQTSGTDGKAVFTNLLPGTYWVKELTPPTGYGLSGAIKVILGFTGSGSGGTSVVAALIDVGPVVNPFDVTIDYRDPRLDGFLRIRKVDSVTGLPVPGATYVVLTGSPTGSVLYRAVTGPDGYITLTGFVWGYPYYVREEVAPAGYALDPNTYGPAIFGPTALSYNFAVSNDPTGGGGDLTVGGLTEGGIQVLAFTGINPFIPIAGGSAVIAGIAMLIVTLRRRKEYLAKSLSQKADK